MAKTKLRVGVIGVGGIANGKHMPALSKLPTVEMVAFCDLKKELAAKGAAEYGVPGAKVYTDYQKMLAAGGLDVVHVCTPNNMHSEITVAALEAGNHVMCEKPMAKTSAEARKMVEAAKKSGKKLTIGYQNRYRPDSLYLKKAVENGDLGDVYFAKALAVRRRAVPTWGVFLNEEAQGGGPLIDIGTHALDLTMWIMNNYEPKTVLGTSYKKLRGRKNAANAWGSWDPAKYTVEDSAFGFITYKNGATIILETSWALNTLQLGEATCILCGTEGGADMLDGLRFNGEKFSRLWTTKPELSSGGVAYFEGGASDKPEDIEAAQWINAVLKDKQPTVLPEQALRVTEILEAIYKSAATGKAIELG